MIQEKKKSTEDSGESGGLCVALYSPKEGENGMTIVPVSPGFPTTLLRLNDSLKGLTELGKLLYPPLWFITPQRYKWKSAKREGAWGRPWGDQVSFCFSLPVRSYAQCLPLPVTTCDSTHQAFPAARLTQACPWSFHGGLGMETHLTAHREAPPGVEMLL